MPPTDNTGRSCDNVAVYSATCAYGLDVVVTFNDPSVRNLLRVRDAANQSQPIAAGSATNVDSDVLTHRFGATGLSFVADFATTGINAYRTGAQFGARATPAPLNPALAVGAWNANVIVVGSPSYTYHGYFAISNVGGRIFSRLGDGLGNCDSTVSTLTSTPFFNGALTIAAPTGETSYGIFLDTDVTIYFTSGVGIGFARRCSTNQTAAPCQPD